MELLQVVTVVVIIGVVVIDDTHLITFSTHIYIYIHTCRIKEKKYILKSIKNYQKKKKEKDKRLTSNLLYNFVVDEESKTTPILTVDGIIDVRSDELKPYSLHACSPVIVFNALDGVFVPNTLSLFI